MPESRDLIERGIRYERGGVLVDALRCYVDAEAGTTEPAVRSEALRRQADVLRVRCDWDAAIATAHQALVIARQAALPDLEAEALNARGAIEQSRGRIDEAAPFYNEARTRAESPRVRACALQNLGSLAALHGDHDEASRCFEGSLECFREAGYERGVAIALNNLGRASLDRGDYERAEEVLLPAVVQARLIDDLDLAAVAMVNLAETLVARGDLDRSEEEASAALGFFKVSGNRWRQVECLKILGDVRRGRGDADVARRLYAQSRALALDIGELRDAMEIEARLLALDNNEHPSVDA